MSSYTATTRNPPSVANLRVRIWVARVLMTTTFDASGATVNRGTVIRTVCSNTLDTDDLPQQQSTQQTRCGGMS